MKKMIASFFVFIVLLGCIGCSKNSIDTTTPIFKTEGISRIILFAVPNHTDGIVVPSEYMDEITAWIGTFTVDKESGDILEPGANTFSFRLEYADGTIVESGVNTTTIDGVTYYMKQERTPECFDALFAEADPTA